MGKGKGNQNTPDAYAFVMINIALNAFRPIIFFRKFTPHTMMGRFMDVTKA